MSWEGASPQFTTPSRNCENKKAIHRGRLTERLWVSVKQLDVCLLGVQCTAQCLPPSGKIRDSFHLLWLCQWLLLSSLTCMSLWRWLSPPPHVLVHITVYLLSFWSLFILVMFIHRSISITDVRKKRKRKRENVICPPAMYFVFFACRTTTRHGMFTSSTFSVKIMPWEAGRKK